MNAALFTYRFFEQPEGHFPSSVGAFILHGRSEMLRAAATRRFDSLITGLPRAPARIHKTGPLTIHSSIWTEAGSQEIDWTELSNRVESEIPVRPESEGACIFLTPSKDNPPPVPDFELPPDIADEQQKEFQRILLSEIPQPTDGRSFLFLGSAFQDDRFERTGVVYMIEALSLTHAAMVCRALVTNSWKTTVLVEWCCSVHNIDSDDQER